jgi:hypothetical protein
MPYRLYISVTDKDVQRSTLTFDTATEAYEYLSTALEIWNANWSGWSEGDVAPALPPLSLLAGVGSNPVVILNIGYADGFRVKVSCDCVCD